MSDVNAIFNAADAAWSAELIKVFGAKSGPVMRYNIAGRGMHGSNLRKIYEEREAARVAFVKSKENA